MLPSAARLFGFSSQNLGSLYKGIEKDTFKTFKHLRKTKHMHNPVDDAKGNAEALLTMKKDLGFLNLTFRKCLPSKRNKFSQLQTQYFPLRSSKKSATLKLSKPYSFELSEILMSKTIANFQIFCFLYLFFLRKCKKKPLIAFTR